MSNITLREILFSIGILLLCVGGLIAGHFGIINHFVGINEKYEMAREIETPEMFNFYLNTNVGDAFTYTDLKFIDTVSMEELGDTPYSYIHKEVEKYTQHTRTVSYKDSNGETHTKVETYWEWDNYADEYKSSKKVDFNGVELNASLINTSSASYEIKPENITGKIDGKDIDDRDWSWVYVDKGTPFATKFRYRYTVCNAELKGASFISLSDNTVKPAEGDTINFYNNYTVELAKENTLKSPTPFIIMLWVFGSILTGGLIVGFYFLENNWLNDED